MPRLPHLHLHRILVDDQALPLVVNARSQAAVRDHFVERHIRIERLTPEEAFQAGVNGAVIETVGAHEDTQQETADAKGEASVSRVLSNAESASSSAIQADIALLPTEGPGPGYVSALIEAASL